MHMRSPEHSRGRLDASLGASKPTLGRLQHDGAMLLSTTRRSSDRKGNFHGRFSIKHRHFSIKHGHFPIKHGHFQIKCGRFPTKHGHFPIKHGNFPIKHGHFQINHGRFPTKHGRFQPGAAEALAIGDSHQRPEGVSVVVVRPCGLSNAPGEISCNLV
jgi:hypothetical protein